MMRDLSRWLFGLAVFLLSLGTSSCRHPREVRTYHEPPPPGLQPTTIPYVDADAFDALFETALTNRDPVIVIQTDTSKPDWGPRLNAWLAAWNRGGSEGPARQTRETGEEGTTTFRGQVPVPVNGEALREFRFLVDDLMTRVESVARRGSTWWAEERTQKRRIALLRPYSLRFHLDADRHIQLIFFNGMYSAYYGQFLHSIADMEEESGEWSRAIHCSRCKDRQRLAEPVIGSASFESRVRSTSP
jgi:hypothetical protein